MLYLIGLIWYGFILPVNLSIGEMGLLGDVNQDGIINVLDVVSAVNFVIGQIEPSNYEFWATDINWGCTKVLWISELILSFVICVLVGKSIPTMVWRLLRQ